MKSSMAATSILLGAILLAGVAAAQHGEVDADNSIRLPSEGKTAKPWDCCDNIEMSPLRIFPPYYRCNDEVKQCGAACRHCEEAPGDFPRAWICRDWYQTTDPGTKCTRPDKKTPWKCCDDLVKSPAKISPPLWHCNDVVKQCDASCKECVEAPGHFPRGAFVCNDVYWGVNPGPVCKARPWGKCCDVTICTKSLPPVCICADEVNKCAATCNHCERVKSSAPPRYVCRDQYIGNPGRKCTFAMAAN